MSNNHRTALITGASAGLGREFARQLAAQGYDLVLVSRSLPGLEETAAEIRAHWPISVTVLSADLSQAGAPQELFDQLQARNLQIDYLVNNAGVAGPGLLDCRDWPQQMAFYQLMMLSIAQLCHLLVPGMCERGFGRVMNIASVAARVPRGGGCNYGPSKAWVVALSEELSLTVADQGVKVCALCPGFTHTEFHDRAGLDEMKSNSPKWVWYDASVVVREGLRAIEKGKRVYLSGRLYRWLDPFTQSVFTRRFFSISDRRGSQLQGQE